MSAPSRSALAAAPVASIATAGCYAFWAAEKSVAPGDHPPLPIVSILAVYAAPFLVLDAIIVGERWYPARLPESSEMRETQP
jgi:hypothetical protein